MADLTIYNGREKADPWLISPLIGVPRGSQEFAKDTLESLTIIIRVITSLSSRADSEPFCRLRVEVLHLYCVYHFSTKTSSNIQEWIPKYTIYDVTLHIHYNMNDLVVLAFLILWTVQVSSWDPTWSD